MSFSTAKNAYGFRSYTPSVPGGLSVMSETSVGDSGIVAGGALGPLPLHWDNPLFWLLLLFLIFTGWLYLGAEFGVRKIGRISAKTG